ncbi:MAG: glutamine-hydrolyzing GMP synthase [Bacteroidales bacterium]|nr:glutamine-hydrolyzing GMP synthase [Bacteroidales bacterium]
MENSILILDFGSQYTQLIARKIRELNVYCEIHPYNQIPKLGNNNLGVILSGSPFSVRDEESPVPDLSGIIGKYPLLGICYGAQFLAQNFGGVVLPSKTREYGRAKLEFVDHNNPLLKNITVGSQVWMSHGDTITELPQGYKVTASTEDVKVGAFSVENEKIYGIQFHPEVYHTVQGIDLLRNFVVNICGASQTWTPDSFVETSVEWLKNELGDDKVILGLSGGVDSSVAAMLLHKAIRTNLICIFIDNGLLRKNEFETVLDSYQHLGLNVIGVRAGAEFLLALRNISDPEKKRKAIGRTFIEIFEKEAEKLSNVKWLAQGTIYPDVIESISVKGPSATIKSHHNVGGLPDDMNLKIIEPLKLLFKDEVRRVGNALELPEDILNRHPFPGPGLGIRILGDVTEEKVTLLQEVDDIFIKGLKDYDLYDKVWQSAAILLPIQSVGVMGDERTYEHVVALRSVGSTDGMTADWSHLPYEFLGKISSEIINQVKGVNRVVYDISSKPPATIEWE